MSEKHTWSTWGHQHTFTTDQVLTPRSIADVQAAVTAASTAGKKLKVVGYSKSSSAIAQPTDQLMRLDFLTGLTDIDKHQLTATFLAGTSVLDANKTLAHYGLAFENLGRLGEQSLAGAVTTGTHGTGLRYGIIATQVESFVMVSSEGDLVECSHDLNPEIFRAALVGLGALGVLVSITFRVVPMFRLHTAERRHAYNTIMSSFVERSEGADHYEVSWMPGSDKVRTRRLTHLQLLPEGFEPHYAQLSRLRRHGRDTLVNNGIFEPLLMLGTKVPAAQKVSRVATAMGRGNRRYADLAPEVFTINRRVRQNNMEYAFDITQIQGVLDELRGVLPQAPFTLSYPLVVRSAAADNIPLSPAYGRPTGFISVREYWRFPYTKTFKFIEDIFKAHGGRPHWGQLHTQGAASLSTLYPEFEFFTQLREELDPHGTFLNPYLEKVLLG
ncbi:D-arabinono-1,4-lactone oxidase [Rothia sp. ZJ1223]|uniref:D-arabinono-1,4-lactone oxidase n=1 Tax=Rothia sp. ZJ1223 TaxID=2811098 RepID=UPI001957F780|nr:FAD-binding protein [Rothia sp. ZJ1223]